MLNRSVEGMASRDRHLGASRLPITFRTRVVRISALASDVLRLTPWEQRRAARQALPSELQICEQNKYCRCLKPLSCRLFVPQPNLQSLGSEIPRPPRTEEPFLFHRMMESKSLTPVRRDVFSSHRVSGSVAEWSEPGRCSAQAPGRGDLPLPSRQEGWGLRSGWQVRNGFWGCGHQMPVRHLSGEATLAAA